MRYNLPTAQGGLNLKDSLDNMPVNDCIQMDNIIPAVGVDKVRPGSIQVGDDGADALMGYNSPTSQQVLTADNSSIYLLDTSLGTRTQLATGFTNTSEWQAISFTEIDGDILTMMANGFDTPQTYDGTTLGDTGFTSVDVSLDELENPLVYKNRVYFVEKDTFKIHYGGVQASSAALTEFNVGAFAKLGGSIAKIEIWTQDGGSGMDDLFVIISTEGEVLIYSGLSPEDASWSTRGVFRVPRPLGKRCTTNLGGDIIIITEQGYIPLGSVLSELNANTVPISNKINEIVNGKDFDSNWSVHWFSKEGWLIVNAPSDTGTFNYEQHVLNTKTGGWCRFVGMDSLNWLIQKDNIYFCNNSGVFKADEGADDNGAFITYYKQQAYNTLDGAPVKQLLRLKPRYSVTGDLIYNQRIGVDFKLGAANAVEAATIGRRSFWDVALWDVDFWSDEEAVKSFKSSVFTEPGEFLSVGLFGRTKEPVQFYSTEVLYDAGDGDI